MTIEPPPEFAHLRTHRLRGEELMTKIDLHAVVPILDRDVLDAMAVVVAGVVDQCLDRPVLAPDALDRVAKRVDLLQVAGDEARSRVSALANALDQRQRGVFLDIDERHARALRAEMLDDALADAGTAAGDEHDPVLQGRIVGVFAISSPPPC